MKNHSLVKVAKRRTNKRILKTKNNKVWVFFLTRFIIGGKLTEYVPDLANREKNALLIQEWFKLDLIGTFLLTLV